MKPENEPRMTHHELACARHALGLYQREMVDALAKIQRVNLRSYQKWEYGEREIPGWVEYAVMEMLREAGLGTPPKTH